MFCFSIMESSFCFANVEFITVPATSFIDDFGPLTLNVKTRTAADNFSQSRFQTSIVLRYIYRFQIL